MLIFEIIRTAFFISAPLHIIFSIGQWIVQFRLINKPHIDKWQGLRCIFFSTGSAFILSLPIWLFWPFNDINVLYNNRLSLPTIMAQCITIPYFMRRYHYF